MAAILISPVQTTTNGGHAATITGIDPTSDDCLIGTVAGIHGSPDREWNTVGICRGGTDSLNLDPRKPEVTDVIETAKMLRNEE